MSLPKEPRQQMINMMYLVLTAMLALNITREVLTAFQTINTSIEKSNASIADKNNFYYKQFDLAEENKADAEKVRPWNTAAKEVKKLSDDMIVYLQQWKDSVVTQSGGYITNARGEKEIKSQEDIDASTRIFIDRKHGEDLKKRLKDYVSKVTALVPDSLRSNIQNQIFQIPEKLPASDENPTGDWVYGTFHNIPVVAVQAMMSKFQNDIKTTEATIVKTLFDQIHATDIKFDDLMAVATPNSTYALAGDEISATVAVVAYNKNINPVVTSNAGAAKVENGIGTLNLKASGAGVRTVSGNISITTQRGTQSFPWKFDYVVGSAGASMQIDKMNVMYIGVLNPITISASGYRIEDVYPVFPAGVTGTKTKEGQYDVKVTQPGNMNIGIFAKKGAGGAGGTKIQDYPIRVKRIPIPNAYVANKMGGAISATELKNQIGIVAKLPDFVYDAIFKVESYRFSIRRRNGDYKEANAKGYKTNEGDVDALIQSAKPGDKVYFDEIKARGPDGVLQDLNSVTLTLK